MSIAKDFASSIKDVTKEKTSSYDTQAMVTRIEGKTAWVHIPGGVNETPVQLTVNASEGDAVQVRVANGKAWITGNRTAPPTDDGRANVAYVMATSAQEEAQLAHTAAEDAIGYAETARTAANDAQTSANNAQTSADNASEYASRALGNLSTVQNVAETLNWITAHGTMTLTTDTALDPSHVYFVQDSNGDYVVGNVHYSVVSEPKVADIGTYYELSIDESLNNYVATHLAVDSEGLWIISDAGGNKVLIATGQGTTYPSAGTYIIGKVNNVDTVLATFGADGSQIGKTGESRLEMDFHSMRLIDKNDTEYFDVSDLRGTNGNIINTFVGDGQKSRFILSAEAEDPPSSSNTAVTVDGVPQTWGIGSALPYVVSNHSDIMLGDYSLLEFPDEAPANGAEIVIEYTSRHRPYALTFGSRSQGYPIGEGSVVCGKDCSATSANALAQGRGTIASRNEQFVFGRYNDVDDTYAAIIGNGTSDTARSNALAVTWDGDVVLCINNYTTSGNVDKDIYDALTALGWDSDCIITI